MKIRLGLILVIDLFLYEVVFLCVMYLISVPDSLFIPRLLDEK